MRNIFCEKTPSQPFTASCYKYVGFGLLFLIITASVYLWSGPASASAQPGFVYEATAFDPHEQVGHNHSQADHGDGGITVVQAFFYAVRAVFYFMLMMTAGLMLWSVAIPEGNDEVQRRLVNKWGLLAMRGLLLVVLLYVFVHMSSLLKGYNGSSQTEWLRLLTGTATGRSWLGLGLFSLLGFAVLRLSDPFKAVWALLLLSAESFNGHVNALPSNTLAIVLDYIHLVCAALWTGGVFLLLLFWHAERKEAGRFAERFTRMAWLTIIMLTVSGVLMTVILLPSWRYLLYTGWGLLLLTKAALLVLIMGTGFFLHRRASRSELPSGKLLKLDGLLMSVTLILVGVLTYVSPIPKTEPLSYHKMGDKLHYTLEIKPNGPGPNRVNLKVWLPEQLGSPASVQLQLRSADASSRNVIEVPLHSDYADEDVVFPGFKETDYYAEKVDLPKRGEWVAELVIIDKADGEVLQTIPFRND
ncbi:CopD family protein [Paenibacillus alkaliterrae]|uniref:copper resistance D family protein n=1 Tax=Paenibacillus alkaliterrae TaxID=320909 RepID=UPI001F470F6B|nr:CopD family protein [Paenibacillus alkaliterrae]MCF2939640.1 CopD family protein [Paenibacillus alkaliterrae]